MAKVIYVSAAECGVTSDVPSIEPTTGTANISVFAKQADGSPFAGMLVSGNIAVSSTGTGNTITAVDTVTDQTGRARFTFASTVSEAKTISATVRGTAVTQTAPVTVAAAGALTPEFFSDFSTATGTGASARSDGGKWDDQAVGFTVIANPGTLGFPAAMVNVIDVDWDNGFNFARTDTLPIPAVGVARHYRWYMRVDIPNGVADSETHPIQDGFSAPTTNWMFKVYHNSAGNDKWRPSLWTQGNAYPLIRWTANSTSLDKGVTYRVELMIDRTSTTEYQTAIRIYDESDVLVADEFDFFREDSAVLTLGGMNPTLTFYDVNELAGLNCGTNDAGPESGRYGYQGGFAVVDDQGWIGAYGSVVGEA